MGDFRIVIEALGGHGCQREKGTGETVIGCERQGCPDCMARELVRRLKRSGATVKRAEIQHWPADLPGYTVEGQVHDDLLTGVRTGQFPEREQYLSRAVPGVREVRKPGNVGYPDAYEKIAPTVTSNPSPDSIFWRADQTPPTATGPSPIIITP